MQAVICIISTYDVFIGLAAVSLCLSSHQLLEQLLPEVGDRHSVLNWGPRIKNLIPLNKHQPWYMYLLPL